MTLLPKDIRDIRRMTKSELLQFERKIDKSIDNIYDRNIKDETYLNYEKELQVKYPNRATGIQSVITVYVKEKRRIKKYIYDCEYCADAKFSREIDKNTGESTDYYKGDCGQAICKYREETIRDIANPKEDNLKKLLID